MNLKSNLWTIFFYFAVIIASIKCINLGLLKQIEVVEEWGCHDTEIRLTCGNLDSKIAILEATFTPNCTEENCLRLDIKRLTRAFHSTPKPPNSRRAETEAGRKFLETIRKSPHSSEVDDDEVIVVDASSSKGLVLDNNDNSSPISSQDSEENVSKYRDKKPLADYLYGQKHSLRASLERLIIRYLRKLSPNENFDYDMKKRSLRNRRWASTTPTPSIVEENRNDSVKKTSRRISLGSRNITINETSTDYSDKEAAELKRRQQETRTFCPEQQRKVSSMDRYDIERSYRNESIEDYNIRRILNRRCSGKNHCSFIFNIDHPFSKIWENGVVRVKYICMDDFRLNHYCGEHLSIGYELSAKAQLEEYGNNGASEPVAEALKSEPYHSLKILQAGDDFDNVPAISSGEPRKRKIKIHNPTIKQDKDQKGVYSQDFKILKILPSNLDDFNDLEKIGDEIYFRKDTDILEKTHQQLFNERQQDLHGKFSTTQDSFYPLPTTSTSSHYSYTPTMSLDNTATTIVRYPAPVYPSKTKSPIDTTEDMETNWLLSTDSSTLVTNPINNTTKFLDKTIMPSALPTTSDVNTQKNYDFFENEIEISHPTLDEFLVIKDDGTRSTTHSSDDIMKIDLPESQAYDEDNMENFDDEIDDSDENSKENEDDDDGDKLSTRKTYTSIQRTAFRSPLLHGFVTTPGYPKFYIGDSECKWQIVAPDGHKIRLTILDISLRDEEAKCMDFLEVVDLNIGYTLFNSCSEDIRPFEIISQSNQIEVIVKTTTKFAYPKRGVLLHYSALGCVNPPIPKNGRLVSRTDKKAIYECDHNYIFPDSRLTNRQLSCTDNHSWNSILPDCIEQFSISNHSGLFESGYNINSRKRPPEITKKNTTENLAINSEMSGKDADMVMDIIIPTILIAGLFIVNGIIFAIIMKYRRRNNKEGTNMELAQL